jgi:tetratricopeptide (TPR) repeat protein
MSPKRSHQEINTCSIDGCLDHIRYAHAAELARTGNYLEAEALLTPNGRVPDSSRELDLLARMAAQQERFDDAARLWKAALERDPANINYKDCLQQLSNIQADAQPEEPTRSTILPWSIAVCSVILLVVLFLSTRRTSTARPAKLATATSINGPTSALPPDSPDTTTNSVTTLVVMPPAQAAATAESAAAFRRLEQTLDQMQQAQREQTQSLASRLAAIQATNSLLLADVQTARSGLAYLAQSITDLNSNQAATERAMESTRSELAALLAAHISTTHTPTNRPALLPSLADFKPGISGVTVIANTNGCLIRFDFGVFDRDCHFKVGAKTRLQTLAKALVQTQARIKVQVIGIAEEEPPTWPWSHAQTPEALGLQRAQCATAYLRRLEIFPPNKLSAVAGIPAQRPYGSPNQNNRTLILQALAE